MKDVYIVQPYKVGSSKGKSLAIIGVEASQDEGVITKAQWNNGYWNVVFDRQIQPQNRGNVSFSTGILEKGWIKFTVWDGSKKGESFANINDNMLVHSNFVLLSYNDVQRNDASLWLGLLLHALHIA
jgi:hypothetical protein